MLTQAQNHWNPGAGQRHLLAIVKTLAGPLSAPVPARHEPYAIEEAFCTASRLIVDGGPSI